MGGSDKPKPPSKIAGGKFEIDKRLGAGCFGEVFRGHTTETKEAVAVKFEDFQGHALQLEHEADMLRLLAKPSLQQGFAELHHFGREGRYHCLVMELLGKSIEDRVQGCKGKFNVQTTVLVAEQLLRRIEYLHSKCIVHRDIKPENFMFGINNKIHHVYLIDFGLSKRYWDVKHVQVRTRLSLTGTARYASINAHIGVEQSRRDDLEAIGHMLMYFLRGHLPWSGLDAKTQEEKYRKIREKKQQFPLAELCKGFPKEFEDYLTYARGLAFNEKPDYDKLRADFRSARNELQEQNPSEKIEDHSYQWFAGKDLGTLVPLDAHTGIQQPDSVVPKPKLGFCFCGGKSATKD
jgi:serine/threonine protein kinase